MIAEIRKHIDTCIKSIDKRYINSGEPFAKDEEVIETKLPYFYNVIFQPTVNEVSDENGIVSNITVSLKTYVQGHRNKLADFDCGYCNAIMIDCLIVDRSKYIGSQYIKNIESTDINPIEVLDSQDVYAFESIFNIKLSYTLGE